MSTIATSTLAGSSSTASPSTRSGIVYVSNKHLRQLRRVQGRSGGALTQIAGTTATGNGLVIDGVGAAANFFGAAGMAFDGNALFVADQQADVVRRSTWRRLR